EGRRNGRGLRPGAWPQRHGQHRRRGGGFLPTAAGGWIQGLVDAGRRDLSSHPGGQAEAELFPGPALPAGAHGSHQAARVGLPRSAEVSDPAALASAVRLAATVERPWSEHHCAQGNERCVLPRVSLGMGFRRKCEGKLLIAAKAVTNTLTILISSHNRAGLLDRTLRYLNEARRPRDWSVDTLVAANACTDGTHTLLDLYACAASDSATQRGRLPLRWVAEPRMGKSHALNCAIPLLNSERVAFVDDDHRVDGGYLESICRAAQAYPEADILCGRILPDWNGSEPAWIHDNGPYRIYPLPIPRYDLGDSPLASPHETTTPGGGNLVLRATLFDRVGDFSTVYGPVGRGLRGAEDHAWVLRAIAA